MSKIEGGQTALDMRAVAANPGDAAAVARLSVSPYYNALLRTTCVATMLEAGHAENALAQTARATANCRLVPGDTPEDVEAALRRALGDPSIAVTPVRKTYPNPASPLLPDILGLIERVTVGMWAGLSVVPMMETGGTDGRLLRLAGIPTYGVSGLFIDPDDVRAHGKDERISVQVFDEGAEFYYRLGRSLAELPSH